MSDPAQPLELDRPQEYDMRCPQCGGDRILVEASCFVEVSRLNTHGNLRIFPEATSHIEPDCDGRFLCGNPKCGARFWDHEFKLEVR